MGNLYASCNSQAGTSILDSFEFECPQLHVLLDFTSRGVFWPGCNLNADCVDPDDSVVECSQPYSVYPLALIVKKHVVFVRRLPLDHHCQTAVTGSNYRYKPNEN